MSMITFSIVTTVFLLTLLLGFAISHIYVRPTKSRAFIRSGHGGERIILKKPAFILPILHKIVPINLADTCISVSQVDQQALMTVDRLRADVELDFYLYIEAEESSISVAAKHLGARSASPDELKQLIEGKFIDAMRTAAAQFTLEQLQSQRNTFVGQVQKICAERILKIGLILESIAVTRLDQTGKEFFDPDNIFDAEGLTKLINLTMDKRKTRNDIEQESRIDIAKKQIDSERLIQELNNQKDSLKLEKDHELAILDATKRAETAKIQSEMQIQQQQSKMVAEKEIEQAEHIKIIDIAEKRVEQSKAKTKASLAKAEAAQAEEQIITAQELEKAERKKQIAILQAAAESKRSSMLINARTSEFYKAHAEGIQSLISAFVSLSDKNIPLQVQLEILKHLPKVPDDIKLPTPASVQAKTQALHNLLQDDPKSSSLNIDYPEDSTDFRNLIDDARKSVLAEAISSLNEFKGGDNIVLDIDKEEIDVRSES